MTIAKIMGKDRDQVKRKYKTMQKKNSNFGFVFKKDWQYVYIFMFNYCSICKYFVWKNSINGYFCMIKLMCQKSIIF